VLCGPAGKQVGEYILYQQPRVTQGAVVPVYPVVQQPAAEDAFRRFQKAVVFIVRSHILMRHYAVHAGYQVRMERLEHFPVRFIVVEQTGYPGRSAPAVTDEPDDFPVITPPVIRKQDRNHDRVFQPGSDGKTHVTNLDSCRLPAAIFKRYSPGDALPALGGKRRG
jgi:hypothetical protein